MDEQSQNAHDELTNQDQFRMSHHMYHLPPRKRRLYKRSVASSRAMRMRGLPPTEYWQRQRISMRRGYYIMFCRIWQDGRKPRRGESFRPPVLSLRGGAKPRRGNPSPALSVSCADSSPTGGAKLGLGGPRRPLPPPWGRCPRRGRRGLPRQKRNPPAGDWGLTFFHIMLY